MDDVASLMGSAGVDTRIKKKGNKYIVDGIQGEFETYEDAVKALDGKTGDQISGQGPTMTSGESAMDFGEEQSALDESSMMQTQPGSKAPGATSTGKPGDLTPQKPDWVVKNEKALGIEYEWSAEKRQWLPKKGKGLMDKANQKAGT